jgi:hypothetical protein
MMIIQKAAVAVLVVLITCAANTAEGKGSQPSSQSHFSAEDAGVKEPVPIPEDVLAVLRTDEMVRAAMANENISTGTIPPSWLSASAIHLSTPEKLDLVVMAEGPLHGSNVTRFWVFCANAHGNRLALTAPAHDLIVKGTGWKGHRNIELTSITATQISTVLFRFDGERYKEAKAESGPIQ